MARAFLEVGNLTETEQKVALNALSDYDETNPDQRTFQKSAVLERIDNSIKRLEGASAKGPDVGDIEDGHRFIGGDPSDPNNWEEVK